MARAKLILQAVGVCAAAVGAGMVLPLLCRGGPPLRAPNPKALTSIFEMINMTGAFGRPGLVLLGVGLGCLALAAILPDDQ